MNSNKTIAELDLKSLILQGIESAKGTPEMFNNLRPDDLLMLGKQCIERENAKHFLIHITDVTLEACSAGRNLVQAKDLFPGYHDNDLKNWELDEAQNPGAKLPLNVYAMQKGKDGTFEKIFKSFNRPIESLIIKQNRIEQFIIEHPELLHPNGYANMFLIEREKDNTRFVVDVFRDGEPDGELGVSVYRFGNDDVWSGGYEDRVVVPAEEVT